MGVSGSGKSTLGAALAAALGVAFTEGDTLHPAANIAKMSAGVPLDDEDRAPFLAAVGEALRTSGGIVITCSALKRRYRDVLRSAQPGVCFVLPLVGEDVLLDRTRQRRDHFMPAALLTSQIEDFERPSPDEDVIVVDGGTPTRQQIETVLSELDGRLAEGLRSSLHKRLE